MLAADGKIYVTGRDGHTPVVKAGPHFQVLATNHISDEPFAASLAVSSGKIFLRSKTQLYCIGK